MYFSYYFPQTRKIELKYHKLNCIICIHRHTVTRTFPHLSRAKSNKSKSFNLFASYGSRTLLKEDPCNRETNMLYSSVKQSWLQRRQQGLSPLVQLWVTDLCLGHIPLQLWVSKKFVYFNVNLKILTAIPVRFFQRQFL